MIMTKIIIPFFALACLLGGVSAQTTKDGDLRECAGRGWNTCDSWKHCIWVGEKKGVGTCYNNCPVIGFPDNVGTTRDCQNLEGCHMVGYSNKCDYESKVVDCSEANNSDWLITLRQCQKLDGCMFNPVFGKNECIKEVNCSAANNSDWVITWRQCQKIDGCKFNPVFGKNECIRDWSAASYVNIQNDEVDDEATKSSDVSSEDSEMPSGDSIDTSASAGSSSRDIDIGGSSNSNSNSNDVNVSTGQDSASADGLGRKSYLRQSRL